MPTSADCGYGQVRTVGRGEISCEGSNCPWWALQVGWLAWPAPVHDVSLHRFGADRTLRVRRRNVGGLIWVAELRRALKLVQ